MAHEIVYVLVEVDDGRTEDEVAAELEATNPAFFVAETRTTTMKRLEAAGTPTIAFP